MSQVPSSEWSREKKEEWATKKMNEMKLKNEKLKQRYAEVEKDRIEAEQQFSAVTTKALPQKIEMNSEENSSYQTEQRTEREWDVGKASNGDWGYSDQSNPSGNRGRGKRYEFTRHTGNGGRGSYGRGGRRDWSSRDNSDYTTNRFQGQRRPRGSFRGRSSANFHSNNEGSYQRSSYKKNGFYSSSQNWIDNPKKHSNYYTSSNAQFSNFENPSQKMQMKLDSDKVWQDDGLNEVQNKQSRVEKWVKSINSEDWSENEEKPSKNYSRSGHQRGSKYYDKPQQTWVDDKQGVNDKNQSMYKNKYDKHEQTSHNTVNHTEKTRKSSSDSSHQIDGRTNFSDKTKQKYKKDNFRYNEHSSNAREIEHSNYKRERANKQAFSQKSNDYSNKSSSKFKPKGEQHNYDDNVETTWQDQSSEVQNDEGYSDYESDGSKSNKHAWGGTWSGQDNCQIYESKNNASGWDLGDDYQNIGDVNYEIESEEKIGQRPSHYRNECDYSSKWEDETKYLDSATGWADENAYMEKNSHHSGLIQGTEYYESAAWKKNKTTFGKNDQRRQGNSYKKNYYDSGWGQEAEQRDPGIGQKNKHFSKTNDGQRPVNKCEEDISKSSGWYQDATGLDEGVSDFQGSNNFRQENSDSWDNWSHNRDEFIPSSSWVNQKTKNFDHYEQNSSTWGNQGMDYQKDKFGKKKNRWTNNEDFTTKKIEILKRNPSQEKTSLSVNTNKQVKNEEYWKGNICDEQSDLRCSNHHEVVCQNSNYNSQFYDEYKHSIKDILPENFESPREPLKKNPKNSYSLESAQIDDSASYLNTNVVYSSSLNNKHKPDQSSVSKVHVKTKEKNEIRSSFPQYKLSSKLVNNLNDSKNTAGAFNLTDDNDWSTVSDENESNKEKLGYESGKKIGLERNRIKK